MVQNIDPPEKMIPIMSLPPFESNDAFHCLASAKNTHEYLALHAG